MFIDTHCHLDFPEFDRDRDELILRAKAQGIDYIINIGSSLKGSRDSIALAAQYDSVYATVGLHPHEADGFDKNAESELKSLVKQDKVVAIGEIGLDYFKNYSKPDNQRPLFIRQLLLAKDFNLPIVIHCRRAEEDTLEILKDVMPIRAVVHCFSGDEKFLKSCLDSGFFVSFTCNITYKKAQNLRDLVKITPLERLMLETDAPYLPPEGLRGRRNDPAYVKFLAEEISAIKGISTEDIALATSENAKTFFALK